ncbi:unnamed protein product [Absidia cylindrospora]
MSLHKKKPVQYFFVDINDPDYYKRIKVARACKDCRKRKSKCDIGKPGSGSCSSCQKHNKICEFTTTTTTTLPSSSTAAPYMKKKQTQRTPVSATVVNQKKSAGSCQTETEFYWSPHHLTLLPEGINYNENNDNLYHYHYPNTTNITDASQFTVTQEDNHLVGHPLFNLPVRCEQNQQKQQQQQQQEKCPVPLIPATPPLLLSSHSTALSSSSSSSSPTATPSPPLCTNYACDATFPWKASKSSYEYSKKAIFMHSLSHMDPVKSNYQPPSYLLQPSELDLLKNYFSQIHPCYPALPKRILKYQHDIPFCLRYAIMALSSLYYHQQPITPTSSSSISTLANDYYNKAWRIIQSRGINDLVSAQTLLLLYKYHETIGEVKTSLLESTQAILGQHQQNISFFGSGDDDNGDDNEEWICRLCWIVYLHQYNAATTTTWKNPPMIRLPCLLPSEQDDNEQEKTISQFLDSIHVACVYTSAMQNLAVSADDEPWSSNPP